MQALILAGGKGTRLSLEKKSPPKALTIIDNKPILEHQINQCFKFGIKNIHLLVGYKHKEIQNYFENGKKFNVDITYHIENKPLGTGGAILNIIDKLEERFIVIYGDIFFNIDFLQFIQFHQTSKGYGTLFLHPNNHPHDSDLVILNKNQKVIQISKKNNHGSGWKQNLVNAAIFIFEKKMFKNLNFNFEALDLVNDLLPNLIKTYKIYGYTSHYYAKDMGTPKRLMEVEADIVTEKVKKLSPDYKSQAIFLDRDGVINEEVGHINHESEIKLINNVTKAIKVANDSGFLMIIITNQPVIARGECSYEKLKIIHNKIETLLGNDGAYLDAIYFCPHHPDKGFYGERQSLKIECKCRKPNIGLILSAKEKYNIDLNNSWFIGDTTSDILAGFKAGVKTILLETGYAGNDGKYKIKPDYYASSLLEAIKLIMKS